ncbi:hypothetical protein J2X61_004277 [Bacillus sp. 3255]|nr:hypothetical protein [Bacillus sp. 3255]
MTSQYTHFYITIFTFTISSLSYRLFTLAYFSDIHISQPIINECRKDQLLDKKYHLYALLSDVN